MKEKDEILVSNEMTQETDRFWDDPKKIMNLIDLLFLWEDEGKKQICS